MKGRQRLSRKFHTGETINKQQTRDMRYAVYRNSMHYNVKRSHRNDSDIAQWEAICVESNFATAPRDTYITPTAATKGVVCNGLLKHPVHHQLACSASQFSNKTTEEQRTIKLCKLWNMAYAIIILIHWHFHRLVILLLWFECTGDMISRTAHRELHSDCC
jgi:hypothetical protein